MVRRPRVSPSSARRPDPLRYRGLLDFDVDTIAFVHEGAMGIGETWHPGVRDPGTLDLIAERVRRHGRQRSHPTAIAADVLRSVIQLHPFWDANHRTGFVLAQEVLRFFGLHMTAPASEVEAFVRSIDARNRGMREVLQWVRRWARPLR